ncbi:DUF6479 family protein [Kitasatospora sp. NPDC001547]|uniref:DUF6479 family protein n=1 Tax=Kitasatospora sp. NPDC001547 TaxID=3364015 RepID=UPI0036A38CD7|nr:hypothetical protein KitaXyl93_77540 [Kitasatospora sp. Xyl93]
MATQSLLAAPDGPSLLAVAVPALAIALLLIGAFAWGSRHLNRRRPKPPRGAPAARADSWGTPDGDGPRPSRAAPGGHDGHGTDDRPAQRASQRAEPPRRSS